MSNRNKLFDLCACHEIIVICVLVVCVLAYVEIIVICVLVNVHVYILFIYCFGL
jgi:hypothetical protein